MSWGARHSESECYFGITWGVIDTLEVMGGQVSRRQNLCYFK